MLENVCVCSGTQDSPYLGIGYVNSHRFEEMEMEMVLFDVDVDLISTHTHTHTHTHAHRETDRQTDRQRRRAGFMILYCTPFGSESFFPHPF